jgi:hypothetical protein
MVLHLAEQLDIPLRERNALLVAAGYAPVFTESSLDEPELETVREAISMMLRNHEPMPALVIDRHWNLVDANAGIALFLTLLPSSLLEPPVNVVRASLHPDGLAAHIVNGAEYARHLIERLRRQFDVSADPSLGALVEEVSSYPIARNALSHDGSATPGLVLPVQLRLDDDELLSFFTTMTVFGAPLDITLSELALESFFPSDAATAARVRALVS